MTTNEIAVLDEILLEAALKGIPMSEYLDKPVRTREEYLIEKIKACTMTKEDWHEWLNMPYKTSPFRSLDIPPKPPANIERRKIEARRWVRE